MGKLEFRVTPGDRNILNLGHKLITVLDPDMAADGSSIIFQPYPESNFLTRGHRIRRHLQLFNTQGPKAISMTGFLFIPDPLAKVAALSNSLL